jgi:hypothetical protein
MSHYTSKEFAEKPISEILSLLSSQKIVSFDYKTGWGDYEGNMEFDELEITFEDGTVISEIEGYNNIFETLSYDKLSLAHKVQTSADFAGWYLYQLVDEDSIVIFKRGGRNMFEEYKQLYPNHDSVNDWSPEYLTEEAVQPLRLHDDRLQQLRDAGYPDAAEEILHLRQLAGVVGLIRARRQ